VSPAETKTLIARRGNGESMPAEFNRNLLAVLSGAHDKVVKLTNQLQDEIEEAIELGDFEMAQQKQVIIEALLINEVELYSLIGTIKRNIDNAMQRARAEAEIDDWR
jgi:hypothetical protein